MESWMHAWRYKHVETRVTAELSEISSNRIIRIDQMYGYQCACSTLRCSDSQPGQRMENQVGTMLSIVDLSDAFVILH